MANLVKEQAYVASCYPPVMLTWPLLTDSKINCGPKWGSLTVPHVSTLLYSMRVLLEKEIKSSIPLISFRR